jgi:hypothetical protein
MVGRESLWKLNVNHNELNTLLASQSIPSWNRIVEWLKQIKTLREATTQHRIPKPF